MKSFNFLKVGNRARAAVLCALMVGGGLAVARGAFSTSHINLKLADANEGPSRVTMAPAAKRAMPAVVKIAVSKMVKTPASMQMPEGMEDNPMFRQFFGGRQAPRPHREGGLGSGVIVSPDGYILTNNHVVDDATDVTVTLPDRREFKGRVVGKDAKIDLAVVKIEASNLPAITVGSSSKLEVGDCVLAVGNPYGVGQTVTMGIISATGRAGLGIEDYEDFIQTDAAINPGNSGGALVNDRGELIGINTAILAGGSGGNQGIGFAVPVNLARQVMDQIVTHGHVVRSYLGVTVQAVTPSIAKAMKLNGPEGALVSQVTPDSPAQRAGLQSGDVITELNGNPIVESNQLRMSVSMMNPGEDAHLKVIRDGQTRTFTVKVEELPGEKVQRASAEPVPSDQSLKGVEVEDLDAQSARQLQLPASTKGVVVTNVDPSSQAAAAGLQEGDVIQEVNRKPVANAQEFAQALRRSNGDSLLLVNRQGNKIFLAV